MPDEHLPASGAIYVLEARQKEHEKRMDGFEGKLDLIAKKLDAGFDRIAEKREWNWQTVSAIAGIIFGVGMACKWYVDSATQLNDAKAALAQASLNGELKAAAITHDGFDGEINRNRTKIEGLQTSAVAIKEKLEALEQKSAMRYAAGEAKSDTLQSLISVLWQKDFGSSFPGPFLPTRGPTSDSYTTTRMAP